ncbi:MAG: AbrB/MazE/SpoVT family DNA-binding domain-containing protein [Propionibacteriaceae bacterium]|jgi:AbrB family looped-hinge helix DNA binding protein|nr:AbrB/MazE/SpoVT family DNA-binding domain-containing protein [Propionibacteriaceae bacterium]
MIATMDRSGRIVIPTQLREDLGLTPGEVNITVRGAQVVIEQATSSLQEVDGHLLLPAGRQSLHGDELREFRLADQR